MLPSIIIKDIPQLSFYGMHEYYLKMNVVKILCTIECFKASTYI